MSDHPREQFGDGFATLLDNEKDFDLLLNVHFNLKAFCSNDSLSLLRIDPAEMIKYSQLSLLQKHKFACSSLNQSVNNEFGGADPLQRGRFAFTNYLDSQHSLFKSKEHSWLQPSVLEERKTSKKTPQQHVIMHSEVLEVISIALDEVDVEEGTGLLSPSKTTQYDFESTNRLRYFMLCHFLSSLNG